MQKEKILIISPFYFPEPISTGKFNTFIVNALKDRAKEIVVICSHPFYPDWKVHQFNDGSVDVQILRGGKHIIYPENTNLRRIILELWFTFFVVRKFIKLRNEIDIIIEVFPPSLVFFFLRFFIKKKTRVIGMVHDLQEVYALNKKGIINKIVGFFINKIEGSALKSCDKLIFLSNEMKITAQEYYNLKTKKLAVQYPFITLNIDSSTNVLHELLPPNKNHIVYSGGLGEKQNPECLYDLYDYASNQLENTWFHFFSQGPIFNKLKASNSNERIKFHSLIKIENLLELYQKSSIQIIPQKPGTSKGSLPSKLPNILVSGCKTFVITDKGSEIERLFQELKLNTVATCWDNKMLFSNLKKILEAKEEKDPHQINVAKKLFNIHNHIDEILA